MRRVCTLNAIQSEATLWNEEGELAVISIEIGFAKRKIDDTFVNTSISEIHLSLALKREVNAMKGNGRSKGFSS